MNGHKIKMYQHNAEFVQLLDRKLDLLESDYHAAKTIEDKAQVLKNHGFDIEDFCRKAIQRTDDRMIKMGVAAHVQRTADFLFKKRRTIYRYL